MQRLGVGGWLFGAGLDHGSMRINGDHLSDHQAEIRSEFQLPPSFSNASETAEQITEPTMSSLVLFERPSPHLVAAIDPSNFPKKNNGLVNLQPSGWENPNCNFTNWVPQPVFCIVLSSHDTCETAAKKRALLALYWLKVHQFLLCSMFLWFEHAMCYSVFCSHLNPLLYRTFPTGPLRPCAQRKMTCSHLVAVLAGHPVTRFSALHGYLQAQNLDEHDRHQHHVQSLLLCSK